MIARAPLTAGLPVRPARAQPRAAARQRLAPRWEYSGTIRQNQWRLARGQPRPPPWKNVSADQPRDDFQASWRSWKPAPHAAPRGWPGPARRRWPRLPARTAEYPARSLWVAAG